MAWTLYLLVWITVMTASAFKYKHTSYERSDSEFHDHYEYPTQEPIGIPDNRAYERMNTLSADISPASYSSNVPDDEKSAQFRIGEQTPTRTENESKVLRRKPYAESRRGQNTDKIVFPETTTEEFQLEIPEHCKRLGFCEDIPKYPKAQANKVISELPDLRIFQDDKLDLPDVPNNTQNKELCQFEEKEMKPKAAPDSNGIWYGVVNPAAFKVETCKHASNNDGQTSALKEGEWPDVTKCSPQAKFISGYEGHCIQKYAYHKMTVLYNGTKLEKFLKMPSSCSCVGKLTKLE